MHRTSTAMHEVSTDNAPSESWARVHVVVPLTHGFACRGCHWRGRDLPDVAAHVVEAQHRVGGDGRPHAAHK
jgi:hypothetical protein